VAHRDFERGRELSGPRPIASVCRSAASDRARRAAPWALLLALIVTWLAWYPPSPDLAAQEFRVHLFSVDGFSLWDNSWYGGHYLPSYSLLFPALGASIGLRALGALSVCVSLWAFLRLTDGARDFRTNAAGAAFALGASGDLFIGRIAFALGVALGLLSVLAGSRRAYKLAAVLSLACAAASPVAAAFLALFGVADWITHRRSARAAALALPAVGLTGALALLMPEGGYEPFALTSLLAAGGAAIGVLVLVPRTMRSARVTSALYLLMLALCYLVPSPVGSNVVRFSVLFAPATLIGAARVADVRASIARAAAPLRRVPHFTAGRVLVLSNRAAVAVLALTLAWLVGWQVNGPLSQSIGAAVNPASRTSFYTPVIRFLERRTDGRPARIEVPFTSSHWDAAILGARFTLARGWERQVDTDYDSLFYEPVLTAAAYRAWLQENAVSYVALSDAPLDFSSVQEGRLIAGGLPFLHRVFRSAHWQVYEVLAPQPLATGPGSLTSLNGDGFTLDATRPGAFLVRVHYTPYWTVSSGSATVAAGERGWTEVYAEKPGAITLDAEFSL
jgi:hypothetical protein